MNIKDDFVLKNINEGYLVGGMVRDFLMEEYNTKDRDISIKGAEKFAKKLASQLDATFITLDNENKIYRLVLKDKENYLDISEMCGENIKEENFIDDPLRILRAYRFMATTGFALNAELEQILVKHKNLILKPARERIHDEIMKLFGGEYTSKTLLKMLDDGILELIFPCVKEIKTVPSNSHHHLDLIHHVIETVRQIEFLYNDGNNDIKSHLNQIDFGGYPRINHLKLAGFLHDIGKPSTWTLEEDKKTIWTVQDGTEYPKDKPYRHRFIKHDLEGAKLVKPLLKELKFSNKQIEYISELIRQHIYPSSVISAPNLDNKVLMRYVRKMGNNVIDNIILAKADRLSAQGVEVTKEMTENNLKGLNKLLNFYFEVKPTLKPLPKLIDGREIMNILKIKQSPILGQIINELHEAQLNGEVNTKEEAIEFINSKQI